MKNHFNVQCRWWSVSAAFISSGVWVVAVAPGPSSPILACSLSCSNCTNRIELPISLIAISLSFLPPDHHSLPLLHLWDTHLYTKHNVDMYRSMQQLTNMYMQSYVNEFFYSRSWFYLDSLLTSTYLNSSLRVFSCSSQIHTFPHTKRSMLRFLLSQSNELMSCSSASLVAIADLSTCCYESGEMENGKVIYLTNPPGVY